MSEHDTKRKAAGRGWRFWAGPFSVMVYLVVLFLVERGVVPDIGVRGAFVLLGVCYTICLFAIARILVGKGVRAQWKALLLNMLCSLFWLFNLLFLMGRVLASRGGA